mmetsp:Transcript_35984/g.99162  ORF Transcript_35984/g.99162 Transcript_35984/m.99162 type:complete len:192 (-) Transcript_35984:103-678(-)|eukprot:CAMPEP_0117559278 /NCGR_PEP_ID=MMETSP0784-20121206/53275_1 /TAXON_ID=39447 /ORGANISM="" /LENGTH=191 /DNA_ID=CAMNT_0005356645 /DNA_START=47 /DNA_END=622 /DNA_ORIENTATION=-
MSGPCLFVVEASPHLAPPPVAFAGVPPPSVLEGFVDEDSSSEEEQLDALSPNLVESRLDQLRSAAAPTSTETFWLGASAGVHRAAEICNARGGDEAEAALAALPPAPGTLEFRPRAARGTAPRGKGGPARGLDKLQRKPSIRQSFCTEGDVNEEQGIDAVFDVAGPPARPQTRAVFGARKRRPLNADNDLC